MKSLLWLFALLWSLSTAAQSREVNYFLTAQPVHAFLWAHDKGISPLKGIQGNGMQVELKRYRTDSAAYAQAHRNFASGFTMQLVRFTSNKVGTALNLSYFMEPYVFERGAFSMRMRVAGGLNLASRPFDSINNLDNRAYSTYINGYLGLGVHANYILPNHAQVFAQATFSHFSNGNTHNPNYGVNFPNIGAGIEYPLATKTRPHRSNYSSGVKWRWDAIVFGCNKSLPILPQMRYWTYGAECKVSHRFKGIHAWTIGMEGYIDQSMRVAMDNHPVYFNRNYDNRLLGALVGHEYLFHRCIFSQQLGVYLYKEIPGDHINRIYHRWGFNYRFTPNWMAGVNLNANLQKAFIFDFRIGYSLNR